jgi:hypothetical protein
MFRIGWVLGLALAIAGCAADGASPIPGFTTLPGQSVAFGPITVRWPDGWRAVHYDVASSFYQALAFLSPEPLPDPCVRGPGSLACQNWPPAHLPANGIMVGLWSNSFPGWSFDPSAGEPIAPGGQPATFDIRGADEACRAAGGDEQIVATIPMPVLWNWWELDACLSGPDHAAGERIVRQMLELPTGN